MNLEALVLPLVADNKNWTSQLKDAIKDTGSLEGGIGKVVTSSAFMASVSVAAFAAIAAATKKGVDEFVKYADEVRGVMQATGQNAEQSSKMVQVLDDLKITTDDINKAQKTFIKEGMTMSIDKLGELSDRYLALNTQEEKNAFMKKNFGKDWLKWVETMQKGSVELHKMNDEQKGNLILTDQGIKDARLYEKQVDNLTDAIHGLWVGLGRVAVEGYSQLAVKQEQVNILMEQGDRQIAVAIIHNVQLSEAQKKVADSAREQAMANLYGYDVITGEVLPSLEEQQAALEELSKANNEFIDVLGGVHTENQRYADETADLQKKDAELRAEKKKLLDQGWWPESDAVQDVNQKIADNNAKMAENEKQHKNWVNQKILDLLLLRFNIDGLTNDELEYYLNTGIQMGIYTEADKQMTLDIIKDADDRVKALEAARTAAETPVVFKYSIQGEGAFPLDYSDRHPAPRIPGGSGVTRRASGGDAYGWTLLGEQGAELVNLPKGSHVYSNQDSKAMMPTADEIGKATAKYLEPVFVKAFG